MFIVSCFQMLSMEVSFMLTYMGLTLTLYIRLIAKSIYMSTALKNRLLKNSPYINKHVYVIRIFLVLFATLILFIPKSNVASVFAVSEQQQPNIKASNIYQMQIMVTGKNIKNLVILIPNEAHEDTRQIKETRLLNQTYVPENAVVNVGTTVAWLNADAGHRHSITLVNNNTKNIVYDSGRFNNPSASKPITLNSTGTFAYTGPSFDRAFPNYKMNGTIIVVNKPLATAFNTTTASNNASSSAGGQTSSTSNIDTVALLITPAKLLDKTISGLKSQGIMVDSQYPFTSLRGGGSASGGDKQQALLVLSSAGKNLNEVTSALAQVASTLPYK
jgi:plastocyanin